MIQQTNKYQIVDELLNEYEILQYKQASEEWEEELFEKIASGKRNAKSRITNIKMLILVVCFVFANIFTYYQFGKNIVPENVQRSQVLRNISDELLINSTLLK